MQVMYQQLLGSKMKRFPLPNEFPFYQATEVPMDKHFHTFEQKHISLSRILSQTEKQVLLIFKSSIVVLKRITFSYLH